MCPTQVHTYSWKRRINYRLFNSRLQRLKFLSPGKCMGEIGLELRFDTQYGKRFQPKFDLLLIQFVPQSCQVLHLLCLFTIPLSKIKRKKNLKYIQNVIRTFIFKYLRKLRGYSLFKKKLVINPKRVLQNYFSQSCNTVQVLPQE